MTLLNLFPAHRRLAAQAERLKDQSITQQDEIRHLKRQLEQATDDRNSAVERAAKAWELMANWLAKRSGLGTISMDGEKVPEAPKPDMEPIQQARPLARDVVNQMNVQFNEDIADSVREWREKAEGLVE